MCKNQNDSDKNENGRDKNWNTFHTKSKHLSQKSKRPFLIPVRYSIKVVYSPKFGMHHLIRFLYFSIGQYSVSLISAYFTRIGHSDVWATFWICYDMCHTFKID